MPGQYGNEKVTIRHLKVVQVDEDKGLLYVTGAVPGNKGSVVLVRKNG
jgi:large subunit ribosomal protein L3